MGNFLDLLNLPRQRNTYYSREERIKREGSPYYTWTVPVTAASAQSVINVGQQFPQARKYEPLDWLEIANNESINDLTLSINNTDTFYIPAGVVRTISGKALWYLAVTNNGAGNTTLNKIIVTLRREPMTIDKWARNRA